MQKENLFHKTQRIDLAFKSCLCFAIQNWNYVHVQIVSTRIYHDETTISINLKDFLDNRKLCACAHDEDVDSYWTSSFQFSLLSFSELWNDYHTKFNTIWHRLSASNPNWGAGGRRRQFEISLIPFGCSKLSLPNGPIENSTVFSTLG